MLCCTLLLVAAGCSKQKKTLYQDVSPSDMGFIACGEEGMLTRIDTEGKISDIKTKIKEDLNGVCEEGGTLVAVGDQGIVFMQQNRNETNVYYESGKSNLYDVVCFKEKWIAVGENGIWTNTNEKEWKKRKKSDETYISVACSDEICICVRKDGVLAISQDGENWDEMNFNEYYGEKLSLQKIVYGGGNFYLLGEENQTQRVYVSALGGVWSERKLDMLEGKKADLSKETFVGMVWDGQEIIVGCSSGKLLTLPDCPECNKLENTEMKSLADLAYCGGYYLLVDAEGVCRVIAQDDANVKQYKISLESARKKTAAQFVDVRSSEEYDKKHIEGSINLEVDKIKELTQYVPDKNQEIIFCCSKGIRSKTALDQAIEMGYTNVYYMSNVEEW